MKYCIVLAAAFMLASCASRPAADIDAAAQGGRFEEALRQMDRERGRGGAWGDPRNAVLFYLDRGMLAHYAGLYAESFQALQRAEQLIEEAFTRSLTQDIGALLVNDNAREYRGENYEDLYISVFNALNLFFSGRLEGALVEIRRLNEKLDVLADRYERAVKGMRDSGAQIEAAQIPMEASRFSNSALARYLGMLFYRAAGNPDGARIEHGELLRAFALAPEIYAHPVPSSVGQELSVPAGAARLNVIAFTGLSPFKEEKNIVIPLPFPPPNHSARIALPVMVQRPQAVDRAEAVLGSGERFALELLEDMGAVANETFRSAYSLTLLRSTARAIARASAAGVGAQAAADKSGGGAGLLVGLLGRAFAEAAERADTRIARFFPARALVGGINLEPGEYSITVNFYGPSGLVNSQSRRIEVRENALNFKRFVWLE